MFALCECTKTFPQEIEVAGYAIADVFAKCGIPMMVWVSSMSSTAKLPSIRETLPEVPEADALQPESV